MICVNDKLSIPCSAIPSWSVIWALYAVSENDIGNVIFALFTLDPALMEVLNHWHSIFNNLIQILKFGQDLYLHKTFE